MEFLKDDKCYLTSNDLAISLNLSIRTIKNELKVINDLLKVYDIQIIGKQGIGYSLCGIGNKEIPDINFLLDDLDYDNYVNVRNDVEDRVSYIACKLLKTNDYIKSQTLSDELFISSSTLSNDIRQVKHILDDFDLKIYSKPYKGIKIYGSEIDIRNCINYLCFKNNNKQFNIYYLFEDDETRKGIESIKEIIIRNFDKNNLDYPEYIAKDAAILIYIGIKRIDSGNIIQKFDYNCEEKTDEIINECINDISNYFNIEFNAEEFNRIKCIIDVLYVDDNNIYDRKDKEVMEKTFVKIYQDFDFDFKKEFHLIDSLLFHIKQLIKRAKNNVLIYNPLTTHILRTYLLSVDLANVLVGMLVNEYGIKLDSDEFSYLVLYFNFSLYDRTKMKDKTIYVCCEGSRAEKQIIYDEIKNFYGKIVKDIKMLDKEDLSNISYDGYNIIVSNSDLSNKIPFYAQYVPADISNKIMFIYNILVKLNEQVEGTFNINELLNENLFFSNENIYSKNEYFEFLFDSLCENVVLDYGEADYLYQNIELMGQEIGDNIVFIRSQNKFVMPFIHITYINEPFYWENEYAKLIIFINFGDSPIEFRVFVYNKIKKIINDKEKVNELLKVRDFTNFCKFLN